MQCINPCSLILNIEGATDQSYLENHIDQNTKYLHNITASFLLPNQIIEFELDGFQLPAVCLL